MSPMDGSLSYAGQTSADSVQMNPSEPLIALKGRKVTCDYGISTSTFKHKMVLVSEM